MKVNDIMTRKPIVVRTKETLNDTVDKLIKNNITGAPVVDDNDEIAGIITDADILAVLKEQTRNLKLMLPSLPLMNITFVEVRKENGDIQQKIKKILDTPVEEIMITNVITTTPEDDVMEALHLMVKNDVTRLPVIKDKKVVGILTRSDIIRGLARIK